MEILQNILKENVMHKVRYALFYDNHTQRENPDVGRDFDVEAFTDNVRRCGVDHVTFHARCNVGMAYYPTKIGTMHPSLKYDLFGQIADSCKRKEISLAAYLNAGISTIESIQHPEWRTVYMPGKDPFGRIDPFSITMCPNTEYREHFLSMIREIAENYPVSGFFIDCLCSFPCVCPNCVKKMREQGIDDTDETAVSAFAHDTMLKFCGDIADTVKKIIPDPMLYFNGPNAGEVRDLDSFYDCECLPTSHWGYEFLPAMAHYLRNIKPGVQCFNMTGRFYDWGDFGGLRNAEALKFDLFYGLAHGMRPNIGGHFHPRGDRDQAVFDRIHEVYSALQKYDPWFDDAKNLADAAIVFPHDTGEMRWMDSMRSCIRMLDELKIQFDIVLADSEKPWNTYKLLILPEKVSVTEQMAQKIRDFITHGGAFFACGKNAAENFGTELGIRYEGESCLDPVYFRMHDRFGTGLDDMFLSLYAAASKASLRGAECAANLVKPYYNACWNGEYAITYTPPQKEVDMPFITVNGRCVWCAGDLFSGYFKRGALHLRDIFRNIVDSLLKKPVFVNENLPAFVRVTVTEQPGRQNVNLIAYAPELRGNTTVVEDGAVVADGRFKILTEGRKVRSVTLAPEEKPLDFEVNDGYTAVRIPTFKSFAMAVVELE